MKRVVVFDLDGTAVDSLPIHYEAIRLVCGMCNVAPFPLKEMCRYWYAPFYDRFCELGVTLAPDHLWSVYNEKVDGKLAPVFPEVITTLDALREEGIPLFVVTACGPQRTEEMLRQNYIRHYFKKVYCDQESKVEVLRNIVKSCGIEPTELVFVGDMKSDILDGIRAGVRAIGFDGGYGGSEILLAARAEKVITSHGQILQLI